MVKKKKQSKLDLLINQSLRGRKSYGKKVTFEKGSVSAGAEKPEEARPGWYPTTVLSEAKNAKKVKKRKGFFNRRASVPEVTALQSGAADIMDIITPASVDLFHRDYVVMDGVFFAYLYLTGYGYSTTVGNGWLNPLIEAGEGINIIFIVNRQPKDKTLSKISQATMINRSRMRDVGDTRSDYEELDSAVTAGMYLKDGMNRYNEDFYFMHTLIEISAEDVDLLEQRVAAVQNLCVSQDMFCKRADYKHGECFQSALPVLSLDPDIDRKSRRNALTSSVAAAFPFSSFEICDQNGIMLGINQHNRSVCIVDIFDSVKYSNANMSIMGMSGAGKTFLLQLMALRLREQGIQIFIVAPLKGHEFRPACEAINGKYIKLSPSSGDCINIMDIRRVSLDTDMELGSAREDSLLADKIQKFHIFFMLLKPNITDEERHYLDTSLIECYARRGITHDNDSLFNEDGSFKEMPVLKDLYELLEAHPEAKSLALSVSRFVTGSAKRLGQATNVDLENKYIVLDISEMSKDLLPLGMFLALDFCWDKCKESRVRKKVLMLDELWCLIGASSNSLAADFVLEIFKIIRGYGGAAIGATQVVRNSRGEGLLCAGRNRISVAFHSTDKERMLITTSRDELAMRLVQ